MEVLPPFFKYYFFNEFRMFVFIFLNVTDKSLYQSGLLILYLIPR